MESLFLSDSMSMFMQGPPDAMQGHDSPYPNLLIKIGGAVLETDQQGATSTICVNILELWMMREVTKSSIVIGNERVGVNLLVKIYAGIRALMAAPDMESLVGELGEVDVEEPGKIDYAAELEAIRNGGNFSAGGFGDESAD
jgi:hypothetical protein